MAPTLFNTPNGCPPGAKRDPNTQQCYMEIPLFGGGSSQPSGDVAPTPAKTWTPFLKPDSGCPADAPEVGGWCVPGPNGSVGPGGGTEVTVTPSEWRPFPKPPEGCPANTKEVLGWCMPQSSAPPGGTPPPGGSQGQGGCKEGEVQVGPYCYGVGPGGLPTGLPTGFPGTGGGPDLPTGMPGGVAVPTDKPVPDCAGTYDNPNLYPAWDPTIGDWVCVLCPSDKYGTIDGTCHCKADGTAPENPIDVQSPCVSTDKPTGGPSPSAVVPNCAKLYDQNHYPAWDPQSGQWGCIECTGSEFGGIDGYCYCKAGYQRTDPNDVQSACELIVGQQPNPENPGVVVPQGFVKTNESEEACTPPGVWVAGQGCFRQAQMQTTVPPGFRKTAIPQDACEVPALWIEGQGCFEPIEDRTGTDEGEEEKDAGPSKSLVVGVGLLALFGAVVAVGSSMSSGSPAAGRAAQEDDLYDENESEEQRQDRLERERREDAQRRRRAQAA